MRHRRRTHRRRMRPGSSHRHRAVEAIPTIGASRTSPRHRSEEPGTAEVEDPAVSSGQRIAPARSARHSDDRGVQTSSTHRSEEPGMAEAKDPTVGSGQPVAARRRLWQHGQRPLAVGGRRHGNDRRHRTRCPAPNSDNGRTAFRSGQKFTRLNPRRHQCGSAQRQDPVIPGVHASGCNSIGHVGHARAGGRHETQAFDADVLSKRKAGPATVLRVPPGDTA